MLNNYDALKNSLKRSGKRIVSIASAGDAEVIETAAMIACAGIAEPILVGDETKIRSLAEKTTLPSDIRILHEPDDAIAARKAARLVRDGEANVLMKGFVNTSDFLRGVLDKEDGIRGESILSHLAAFEVPDFPKLMFHTDGGVNLYPDLQGKIQIVENAVAALHALGVKTPKVAALSANEVVNPKVQSSLDAETLAKMNASGEISGCIIEGPMAMDVALSSEAARHKKIESRISGDVDIFLFPNIDAGNMTSKAIILCAHAKMAGVVLGAKAPIVLASRSDNAESKYNSVLLACAMAENVRTIPK